MQYFKALWSGNNYFGIEKRCQIVATDVADAQHGHRVNEFCIHYALNFKKSNHSPVKDNFLSIKEKYLMYNMPVYFLCL